MINRKIKTLINKENKEVQNKLLEKISNIIDSFITDGSDTENDYQRKKLIAYVKRELK
jgi:hypothetical protein